MDAKNVAHIVAGMATMSRNSTTRVHRLAESAEEAGTAAVAAMVAETAAVAAAALLLAGRRVPVLLLPREWLLLGLEDGWDQPGRSKAYLVEAATEEFVAESAAERIGRSRCIGCREVPF